jgi:putative transcriptional regulator
VLMENIRGQDPSEVVDTVDVHFGEINVRAIREDLGMTQMQFASAFGLAIGSVRNWEQGRSVPDASMRSYITVIKNAPYAVIDALEKDLCSRALC